MISSGDKKENFFSGPVVKDMEIQEYQTAHFGH